MPGGSLGNLIELPHRDVEPGEVTTALLEVGQGAGSAEFGVDVVDRGEDVGRHHPLHVPVLHPRDQSCDAGGDSRQTQDDTAVNVGSSANKFHDCSRVDASLAYSRRPSTLARFFWFCKQEELAVGFSVSVLY